MTNKDKVNKILKNLSEREICFVSERNLQVEFDIEAKKEFGECNIYPEYVFPDDRSKHIDLIIKQKNKKIAFEFKYIVCKFEYKKNDIDIKLRNQSALPVRRYNCMTDISRLETLKKDKKITEGYFILITNDKKFWTKSKNETIEEDFKFDKGIIKAKTKNWRKDAGKGTIKGHEKSIIIKNEYKIDFKTFKEYENQKKGLFKQLVLKI